MNSSQVRAKYGEQIATMSDAMWVVTHWSQVSWWRRAGIAFNSIKPRISVLWVGVLPRRVTLVYAPSARFGTPASETSYWDMPKITVYRQCRRGTPWLTVIGRGGKTWSVL